MASDLISFTVTFRGVPHALSVLPDTTLAELYLRLEELTGVPPPLQKLLYKNKKAPGINNNAEQMTIIQAGLQDGIKVQMLGSTTQEIEGLKGVEDERTRIEGILRKRALKAPVKLRSTGSGPISTFSSSSSPVLQYRFHNLKALEHLPNPSSALTLLTKLSEDPAIKHVMQQHKFSVGLLTELAPHEHPGLLGLNENAGQAIKLKLRLRTDRYDGFRSYKEIRRILCHELTHNVWEDHDHNFKELNSKLNREVVNFESSASEGTHYLSGHGSDIYQPSSELEAEAQAFVLGGAASVSSSSEPVEERRSRILKATINRLNKEEEVIEHSCGTGRSTASST